MEYTRKQLFKKYKKDIIVNSIELRKFDNLYDELISEYGLEKLTFCGDKLAVWGLYDFPMQEEMKEDFLVEEDGQKREISSCVRLDNLLDISGYYPVESKNLFAKIDVEELSDNTYQIHLGDYSFKFGFVKVNKTAKAQVSGYTGAATFREYNETINEPVRYNEVPLWKIAIGDSFESKEFMCWSADRLSICLYNINDNKDTVSVDVYSDTYNMVGNVYLSENESYVCSDGKKYSL